MSYFPELDSHITTIVHNKIDKLLKKPLFEGIDLENMTEEQNQEIEKELKFKIKEIYFYTTVYPIDIQYIYDDFELLKKMLEVINKSNHYIEHKLNEKNEITQLGAVLLPRQVLHIYLFIQYDKLSINIAEEYLQGLANPPK